MFSTILVEACGSNISPGYYFDAICATHKCYNAPTGASYTKAGTCDWACNPGRYQSGNTCPTCYTCGVGQVKTECSGTSEGYCQNCAEQPGKYFTSAGSCLTAACPTCALGQYSDTCFTCAACAAQPAYGSYTAAGSCGITCIAGRYYTGSICSLCTTSACSTGQYRTTCPAGSNADAACTSCTNGPSDSYYSSAGSGTGTSNCAWQCNANFYKNGDACTACNTAACSIGQYRRACSAGSTADATCTACTNGPSNSYYTSTATGTGTNDCNWQCNSGYYKNGALCTACSTAACSTGQYRITCSAGNSYDASYCTGCTNLPSNAVYTSAGTGVGTSNCAWQCNANFYKNGAACTACNTAACSIGQYRRACSAGSTADATCTACTNGVANSAYTSSGSGTGTSNCAWQCNSAYYKNGAVCTACTTTACSTGQYRTACSAGSSVDSSCTACTNLPISNAVYTSAGNGTGTSNCLWQCNAAYYNNNGTCSSCSVAACATGQYRTACSAGSIANSVCLACTNKIANSSYTSAGTGTGTSNCAWQCVANYFLNAGVCPPCPQYTSSPAGSTAITVCTSTANYYGSPGNAASPCPPNSASLPGSTVLNQCLSNAGYEGAGTIIICTPDFYCPGSNVKVACPNNTFTNGTPGAAAASNCIAKQGYYGTAGTVAQLCPTNTSSQVGSVNLTDCVANKGFYGAPGAVPVTCPSNFYCPSGATSALPCLENTNSPLGSSAITDCKSNQGYYGQPGTNVTLCPPSAYCPSMSVNYNTCPTFSTSTSGSFSIANCTPIPGYYRNPDFTMASCEPGWYCPEGSLARIPCPTFTSSPDRAALLTQCTAIAGYYGQPGSVASACPLNTYSPNANTNSSIFSCTCNSGFTCEYKNNVYVTVSLNLTADKFTSYTRQYIVATLADAAAVTMDKVVPTSDKVSLGSSTQISYWINGASALYYAATCSAMLEQGSNALTIISLSWQNQESVKVNKI